MSEPIQIKPEVLDAAAEWWCEQIKKGRFDNGDKSFTGALAGGMASILYRRAEPFLTPEFFERFKAELKAELAASAASDRWFGTGEYNYIMVQCDYHPMRELADAAVRAGLPEHHTSSIFPWKTWMRVHRDRVIVAAGYGTKPEELAC